jgi:hypothetical protein
MILISHRGNINGRIPDMENRPTYILDALLAGYDCEIDVRLIDREWYLGHDEPQYKIEYEFLLDPRLWVHCKNHEALEYLILDRRVNCFWHEEDKYTLTSHGYIWAYPGSVVTPISNAICVLPELNDQDISAFIGICTDEIIKYEEVS